MRSMRSVVRIVIVAVVLASVAALAAAFLSWRNAYNQEKALTRNLWRLSLALRTYAGEHGEFPRTLDQLKVYDVPRDTLRGVVYTYWGDTVCPYELPGDWASTGKMWFYYPLDHRTAWVCVDSAVIKGVSIRHAE